jgi:hypothetical protein
VNNLEFAQAVGWNVDQNLGVLWEQQDATDWLGRNLASRDITACPGWTVWYAHDINDAGWIAAIADGPTPGTDLHAVLLVPNNCTGDLNCDNTIDADDLLLVINGWGECEPEVPCPGDGNLDGVVDVDDLLLVINGYGDCELPSLNSLMSSGGFSGANESVLEDILEYLDGLNNVPQDIIDAIEELLGD